MKLGVQYYRPPFPVQSHWADDLARIRDSGLEILQLWVTWAWVESRPGVYDFSDYDRLVEMAGNAGLEVMLSTIAEIQPHWIHHEIPGSEMIDNRGLRVVSSNREESHFGLTPGGCTEHPEVWRRMSAFLTRVVERYRDTPHLAGWDAWNELRWHEQSDGLVCFCPHCIGAFHRWLDARHGGLEGLNRTWQRRHGDWREVAPGKTHWRTFTEMMAWQRFITWKANRHGKARYDLMKALDPRRPVTVHAGDPSPVTSGGAEAYAIDRGNDWFYADELDGVGCSSFPKLFGMDETAFSARVEFASSAATSGGKKLWLSEVQGGRGALGFAPVQAVTATEQQHWVWRGFAAGAEKILFWCWRDEIFGRESSGFGLAGGDGHAEERLSAMARTGDILRQHRELLAGYTPDAPSVGVLFSPATYYLHWSLEGHASVARRALEGYCRALVERSIPYTVVEEEHLDTLDSLKILFLPRTLVMGEKMESALATFVRRGGTLVCEAECGAYTPEGLYRYPQDRFISRLGLIAGTEAGRRDLPPSETISLRLPGEGALRLDVSYCLSPWSGFPPDSRLLAEHPDGVLAGELCVDEGRIVFVGAFLGGSYLDKNSPDFPRFVSWCVDLALDGRQPPLRFATMPNAPAKTPGYLRSGVSSGKRLACVFPPDGTTSASLVVAPEAFGGDTLTDLITGRSYRLPPTCYAAQPVELVVETDRIGVAVLAGQA